MKPYMSHFDTVSDFPCNGLMYSIWKSNGGLKHPFKCVMNEPRPPNPFKLPPALQYLIHETRPS